MEGYEGEPGLLEELGVNFEHINMKTLPVLNPLARIDQHIMDDSDLAGRILFFLLFGTFLLFSGKVHFGYIYGLALLGSTSLHIILSLMSPSLLPTDIASSPPSTSSGQPKDHKGHSAISINSTLTLLQNGVLQNGVLQNDCAGPDGSFVLHFCSTLASDYWKLGVLVDYASAHINNIGT